MPWLFRFIEQQTTGRARWTIDVDIMAIASNCPLGRVADTVQKIVEEDQWSDLEFTNEYLTEVVPY